MFEFGKDLFDGIEVWAVGRQENEMRAFGSDGGAGLLALVGAEVVENDDIARPEGWREDFLDICDEESAIHRAIDHPRRVDPVMAERADESERLPMPEWSAGLESLAFWPPASERRHIGFHPGFVDENKAFWVNPVLMLFPARPFACNVGPILLRWQDCFF